MKKISYKVALGGVLAAVALLIMFTTGLAPFLTYVAPMFAGMLAIMMMVEVSYGWATLTYVAVAILCILITPDREAAFRAITRRLPFYMGATLLRIARNSYLEKEYRRALIEAAGRCLRRE